LAINLAFNILFSFQYDFAVMDLSAQLFEFETDVFRALAGLRSLLRIAVAGN